MNVAQGSANHYVVLEGDVASDVMLVLDAWLVKMNSQRLTENIWVYSAMDREGTLDIFARLREISPTNDWKPFRILFLWPHGNGCFAYKMPSISISGDGAIGTGGFAF
jgi:hypothetical protein